MLLWCLSGVVMLFVGYPELSQARRVQGLAPIDWSACCRFGQAPADSEAIASAGIEGVAGVPVLRLGRRAGPDLSIDLRTGAPLGRIDARQAAAVASAFAGRAPAAMTAVDRDQWTVSGDFNADRPLWKASFADPSHIQVYVSSATGMVVQATTGGQRFWNQIGAVPHWLYFTQLRRNGALWNQVVIWTSVLGVFLTLTGLYVGWTAIRPGAASSWSPYRGARLWHHLAGLVFGVLTLTWVVSGLLSMNPWGLLEGGGGQLAVLVQGPPPSWAKVRDALAVAARTHAAGAASVKLEPLAGRVYLTATARDGRVTRLGADGAPAPLVLPDLLAATERLSAGRRIVSQHVIDTGDAYYFRHHTPVRLPAYRVVLKDGTRVYLDLVTGRPLAIIDGGAQGYRWLHQGLHRLDVIPGLRRGPVWTALMLVLLTGVAGGLATGVWLSWKAVARDVRGLVRRSR